MPSLVVGSDSDTLFVRTALRTGLGGAGAGGRRSARSRSLDKPLSPYACVFLCNALPLPGQAITALEDYVKAGGVMVVFPGCGGKARTPTRPGPACRACRPPSRKCRWPQRNRTLTWDQPQHLLVRSLREGIAVPALAIRRRLVLGKIA